MLQASIYCEQKGWHQCSVIGHQTTSMMLCGHTQTHVRHVEALGRERHKPTEPSDLADHAR